MPASQTLDVFRAIFTFRDNPGIMLSEQDAPQCRQKQRIPSRSDGFWRNFMNYRLLAEDLLNALIFHKLPTEKSSQMSSGEVGILTYLNNIRNDAPAGEISRHLGISTGRTAIALKSLEKKGYVMRANTDADKRRVIVSITRQGSGVSETFRGHVLDAIEALLCKLGDADASEYVRLMKRVLEINEQDQ